MNKETLELVTKLSELKKRYEILLYFLNNDKEKPQIAVANSPEYKRNKFGDESRDYAIFYDDKEVLELVKEYCRKKIENYEKQIEAI